MLLLKKQSTAISKIIAAKWHNFEMNAVEFNSKDVIRTVNIE